MLNNEYQGTGNWFIIYPQKNKEIIKTEFEKLNLEKSSVGIIIIKDNLFKEEENEYVKFINKNLKYNSQICTSSELDLGEIIEEKGGADEDDLYFFKDGKVIHKKLYFDDNLKLKL